MRIIISNSSPDPIYEQISRQVRTQVISGELNEGDALPSIRKLAKELQVSAITTKRAYDELEKEGFLDTVGGKGTFVANQNTELLREMRMRVVEEKLGAAIEEAKGLGLTRAEMDQMIDLLFEGDE